ncbi:FtsX-like permease family protein [Pseudomonas sp. TNT2022 ID1048]|uniref:ABC transporter permease n=1 Tax=Pseudomonas idahonensis TaxID=2942628 RepID=UPI0023617FF7|nr:FtsX-like permease family protein [Pseudomonas idahonensis]MDD1022553.1 FtsX-like permease family protein [Pseudomonas idahonensis]
MHSLILALKNAFRNGRRTLVTLLAIAFGLAAINLFSGYVANVYKGLEDLAVMGERLGHLTLTKRGFWLEGKLDPTPYLIAPEEAQRIENVLRAAPHIKHVSPRLSLNGLASNGRASTIFISESIAPEDDQALGGSALGYSNGQLDARNEMGVAVSSDLAKLLNLQQDTVFSLLSSTFDGQANAVDAMVTDVFNTGTASTNDKFILLPLKLAQALLNTDAIERFVVVLDDAGMTETMGEQLQDKLRAAGIDVEFRTWKQLSNFYTQVKSLFDVIFSFIASIVLVISAMSVANTMSMAVVERTREIGTLRALGLSQNGVIRLFALEGFWIAAFGCLLGLVLTLVVALGINLAQIGYIPPNLSTEVPLQVDLDWLRIVSTALVVTVFAVLCAAYPAYKATRNEIVDALTFV